MGVDRLLNIKVIYTKTNFGQKFISYLGPVSFNFLSIELKKYILNDNTNIKKCFILSIKPMYKKMYNLLVIINIILSNLYLYLYYYNIIFKMISFSIYVYI